ncbi:hypothetical protein DFH11DRAFT_1606367 [Phellopilus nigrolimitatus]|nr:hypothetical protein DFH11DRAFT_1606367 [Phellopilus nigrolimitatus]
MAVTCCCCCCCCCCCLAWIPQVLLQNLCPVNLGFFRQNYRRRRKKCQDRHDFLVMICAHRKVLQLELRKTFHSNCGS